MTAEIAVLNKTAVALAADSAVTISAGRKEEKIYDSADKLFELSRKNPIGIMIYNGMQFMQAPLPILISKFRSSAKEFDKIEDAARAFLDYLNAFGKKASSQTIEAAISNILDPILERINDRASKRSQELFEKPPFPDDVAEAIKKAHLETVSIFEKVFDKADEALFIGGKSLPITPARMKIVRKIVEQGLGFKDIEFVERVVAVCKKALHKEPLSPGRTGIVIAGFGTSELFPTLISFEIDGMVFGRLKYTQTNHVDIDRGGARAKVLPFAQKEMVERFLYGMDTEIERNIAVFCQGAVTEIKNEILGNLVMNAKAKAALTAKAKAAEDAFISQLKTSGFEKIRSRSKSAIEDMVEFMPKPELATMAESLVNLTSIKRRFSRGMETVGGPIDVCVISQSEGFIWVKRKHYFTQELNPRYLQRVSADK
jgi:hypothetical protein